MIGAMMRKSRCLKIFSLLMAITALAAGTVLAQPTVANYPARPVTIISPYVPGSSTQLDGRVWADKLQEIFGKPFLIDFKPGAGTTLGNNYVAKASPDGYTLLIVTGAYTISAATYKDLPYDPIRDLAPVSLNTKRPTMLVVNPGLPVNTLVDYIAYAKARPEALNLGTTGVGGQYHLLGAWLHSLTNTKATFVHYKGAGPVFVDLVAGRIDVSMANFNIGLPYVKSGKLRPIAILSSDQSPLLPGIKTADEQGAPGYEWSAWGGILAPARVPPPIINKLSVEFAKIAKMPDVIARFANDGTVLVGSTPEEFRKLIVTEISRWKQLVKDHDIKADEE